MDELSLSTWRKEMCPLASSVSSCLFIIGWSQRCVVWRTSTQVVRLIKIVDDKVHFFSSTIYKTNVLRFYSRKLKDNELTSVNPR